MHSFQDAFALPKWLSVVENQSCICLRERVVTLFLSLSRWRCTI